MGREGIGLLVGGAVPALLLGVFANLQKAGIRAGASPGLLLVLVGAGSAFVGGVFLLLLPETAPYGVSPAAGDAVRGSVSRLPAILFSLATGVVWAVSTGLVSVAISRFDAPLAKLVPIFNINTLVAVLIGLLVFQEWKEVQSPKLLVGAVLIVIGGTLAATS